MVELKQYGRISQLLVNTDIKRSEDPLAPNMPLQTHQDHWDDQIKERQNRLSRLDYQVIQYQDNMKNKLERCFSRIRIPDKYIFSYKNKIKEKFDLMMIICAIINSFFIPLELTFDLRKVLFERDYFKAMDFAIDTLFIIDMLLMFFQTYLNKVGQEERDPTKIAKHYMFSMYFLYDGLSILGSGYVASMVQKFKIFGFFKMTRIRRIGIFITKLNLTGKLKSVINIFKIVVYLMYLLHIQTCLWWFCVSQDAFPVYKKDEEGKETNELIFQPDIENLWKPLYTHLNYKEILFRDYK